MNFLEKNGLKIFLSLFLTFSYSITADTKKLLIFGDSISAGYGIKESENWVALLTDKLNENSKINYILINSSVSGDTTSGGLNRLKWLLEKKDTDIAIVCLGANDMLRGIKPNLIKQNLNQIMEILKEQKVTVLLAGMLAQETFGEMYKKRFDKIYPELAKKFEVAFLPFLLDGVALNPKLNLKDGKHPNHEGIKLISKNLEKKLIDLLKAKSY